ncbi:MAG: hypothetical protein UX02_C0010G0002 [Candidatus Moranbacteria bacterium GW2011_GWC1_45_18]|nr:MAG: hypothetical protein UX02_C0010G0002 [Candidatus Moranbacteria bacterium GW2011_GWC1_45_18]
MSTSATELLIISLDPTASAWMVAAPRSEMFRSPLMERKVGTPAAEAMSSWPLVPALVAWMAPVVFP